MTNPPDPKTKTPSETEDDVSIHYPITVDEKKLWALIQTGDAIIKVPSELRIGFWLKLRAIIAAQCKFSSVNPETLQAENQSLTRRLEEAEKERDAYRSEVVSVINHLPSNCIVHVTDLPAQESDCATLAVSVAKLAAKLTALRTVAEAARDALEQSYALALAWAGYYSGIHGGNGTPVPSHADILTRSQTALAALRAELDQADSNASNSPTASRESQG